MSDAAPREGEGGLKAIVLIAYGLFIAAPFNGLTAIAGVILLYVKRDEARGTPWESHVRNLLWVFWISAAAFAILFAVILAGVGSFAVSMSSTNGNPPAALVGGGAVVAAALMLVSLVFFVWYLFRTLKGLIRALESRPY